MELSSDDKQLIQLATELVSPMPIPGGIIGEVGAALRTKTGEVFTGICLHLVCGLGCCAEHTAIGTAVTKSGAIEIDTIVAVNRTGIISPCGRCRELMNVLSPNGAKTWVILNQESKVQLAELLPNAWNAEQAISPHLTGEL